MKCDFCGQETDKNYFTDDFTVLCKTCAGAGSFCAGEQAVEYIDNKAAKGATMNRYRKYTKGDCYTMCELLEFLLQNKTATYEFSQEYNYEPDYVLDLLKSLLYDIDSIIGDEQDERDNTDQMADIMELKHIPGHDDYKGE